MSKEEIDKVLDTYNESLKTIDELLKEKIKNAEKGEIDLSDYDFCVYITTDYGVDFGTPKKLVYSPSESKYGVEFYLIDIIGYSYPLNNVFSDDRVSLYKHIRNGK